MNKSLKILFGVILIFLGSYSFGNVPKAAQATTDNIVIEEAGKIIVQNGDEISTITQAAGAAAIVDGVETIDDANKVLQQAFANDADALSAAKEQAAEDIANNPDIIKDKSWLVNIIKGKKFEEAVYAEYSQGGNILRSLEQQWGLTEGYLNEANGFSHLKQVQINIGNGEYWVADDIWVKGFKDEATGAQKFECYISESKLNESTALSTRQSQFGKALQSQSGFTIRSTDPDIISPMRPSSTIEVRQIIRTNGPDINNTTFTQFK